MEKICANCGGKKQDNYFRACEKCRAAWRKAKTDTKEYWLGFYKDPHTGGVNVACYGHNCIADCRHHPDFIGMKHIKVDMENLKKC